MGLKKPQVTVSPETIVAVACWCGSLDPDHDCFGPVEYPNIDGNEFGALCQELFPNLDPTAPLSAADLVAALQKRQLAA